MLESIKRFVEREILGPSKSPQEDASEHALQLATAALLIETARADFGIAEDELQFVADAVRKAFALSREECDALVHLAKQEAREATSLYEFTTLLDKGLPLGRKVHVIELMWQVAFSDGVLHKYEEHLVRKVAELLHVPHREFIKAKHRATSA